MTAQALLEDVSATAASVLLAVTPLVLLFLVFQIFMLKLPLRQVKDILVGTAVAALGLFLFLLGVGVAFLPFGRALGEAIGALNAPVLMTLAGLALGFATAWGEPAVRILADQVEESSHGAIRGSFVLHAICIGVAIWVGLGILRLQYSLPLIYLLAPGYGLVLLLMWFSDQDFVAIAIDAGGVATGPIANSFLLAVALGVSSVMPGQDPIVDGLGFVSLIALAPLISVMALGLIMRRASANRES